MKKYILRIVLSLLIILLPVIGTSGAYFSSSATVADNTVTTGCWIAPAAPNLSLPADGINTDALGMVFSWASSTSSCPIAQVSYQFEAFDNLGLTGSQVYSSLWASDVSFNISSINEGTYYWRVRVKDQFGNENFSLVRKLTVDRTAPSSVSLSITGSFTKSVTEKISNGDFEEGLTGWTTAGNVDVLSTDTINDTSPSLPVIVTPVSGSNMAVIGNATHDIADDKAISGNNVWENRLMGSFDSGAKSLSLNYNFFTRDFSPFDDPGFFVRLNGQEIFKLNTLSVNPTGEIDGLAYNTGWSEFYYDLSNQTGSKVNLSLYAGNTGYGDKDVQSWVYIDEITTYFVSAPAHAVYTLSGDDDPGGSGINHYEYNIDGTGWATGSTFGNTPPISNGGEHTVQYRSVDNAGNYSPIYTIRIITDDKAPSNITDLSVDSDTITPNSITLSWNAPYNDSGDPTSGKAALYDVRYSTASIDESNFAAAVKVDKIPSPKEHNTLDSLDVFFDLYQEHLEIIGLNPSTVYYFAVKAADEAPNWSGIATASGTTTAFAPGTTVNTGDIVINEMMWMGSSVSYADEWLELKNMTDRTIDLSGFKLTKFDGSIDIDMAISFAGKSIGPHSYLLIANDNSYAGGDSQLKDTINPDIWDSSLDLSDTALQIKLYWNDGTMDHLIDSAWDGSTPTEGVYGNTFGLEKYYSMERTFVPGDGSDPLNWYTCIDGASTADFFDNSADERGTPGEVNRSENEPLTNQPSTPRITSTLIESGPTVEPLPTSEPAPTPAFTPGQDVQENASESAEITTTEIQEPVETPEPAVQPKVQEIVEQQEPVTEPEPTPIQPESTPEPPAQPAPLEEIINE